jgi:hypothetical protein
MNDTLLMNTGMRTLIERFGVVDAERFIYLINREQCNYTGFRHALFEGMSMEDICREAKQAKREADERSQSVKS